MCAMFGGFVYENNNGDGDEDKGLGRGGIGTISRGWGRNWVAI